MEKLIRIIMKHWIISTILLFLFFMWFPIIFYFTFMTWEFPNLYMEDNPWIGFIGGYFGAIFGGIVSGLFTFLGIRYTIKNNEKENFLATYFERKFILEEVIAELWGIVWAFDLSEDKTTQKKIEIQKLFIPTIKELADNIYKEIGGSIGAKVLFHANLYKSCFNHIELLDDKALEKLVKDNFSLLKQIQSDVKAHSKKLDDRYSKYQ